MNRVTLIVAATTNNGIGQAGKLPWRLPQEMQYFARVTTGESDSKGKKNAVVMGRATWESIPRRFRPLPGRINFVVSRQADYELCVGGGHLFFFFIPSCRTELTGVFWGPIRKVTTNAGASGDKELDDGASKSDAVTAAILASSLGAALENARAADANRVFVIGGARLYAAALPLAERVLLTRITEPAFEECDVFMPDFIGGDGGGEWTRAPHDVLCGWVGFDVPSGVREERGVKYEFEMWVRKS
jgi:dihydrofolate reductase